MSSFKHRYETNKWEAVHVSSEEGVEHATKIIRRLRVPGGWFIQGSALTITFYPDPDHVWQPPFKQ